MRKTGGAAAALANGRAGLALIGIRAWIGAAAPVFTGLNLRLE